MKEISISEFQSIYDGIKSQIIYMSFMKGSGLGGWFGRRNELGLTIFIREDFFSRYKSKFDKIDNRTSVYDEMKTIEKILNTEESIFIYTNTD